MRVALSYVTVAMMQGLPFHRQERAGRSEWEEHREQTHVPLPYDLLLVLPRLPLVRRCWEAVREPVCCGPRPCSSVGQSTRLVSEMSPVRTRPGAPRTTSTDVRLKAAYMQIRECRQADLPALIDLTIEAFRP